MFSWMFLFRDIAFCKVYLFPLSVYKVKFFLNIFYCFKQLLIVFTFTFIKSLLMFRRFFYSSCYPRALNVFTFNFYLLLWKKVIIDTKKFSQKYFVRFRWMFATFDFIPVNIIEFLIKFFNCFTNNIPFIYIYIYIYIYYIYILYIYILLDFCFHLSLMIKNTNQKMIINITFKNCSFKIGINKTICDDMVYCCCCFFSYSSRFIYYWNHIILVQ